MSQMFECWVAVRLRVLANMRAHGSRRQLRQSLRGPARVLTNLPKAPCGSPSTSSYPGETLTCHSNSDLPQHQRPPLLTFSRAFSHPSHLPARARVAGTISTAGPDPGAMPTARGARMAAVQCSPIAYSATTTFPTASARLTTFIL